MIPFYRPYYDHRELIALLWPGSDREKFEAAVAARAGAKYGIAFAYARAGLVAAFGTLGITDAEIILPAYTCLVMAHTVLASGNRPVFVDIDLADYNMNIDALQQALTPHTQAVIATHMYGYPTDVDAIRASIGDERILIVEDCALGLHLLTTDSKGLRGDLGMFSFGPGKPLSSCGGGMLVTNSADLYEKIRMYRDELMDERRLNARLKYWIRLLASQVIFRKPFYDLLYRPKSSKEILYKFNIPPDYMPPDTAMTLPAYQARVGMAQLQKTDLVVLKRRTLAKIYNSELENCSGIHSAPFVNKATFSYYTLRVPKRDEHKFEAYMISRGVAIDRSYNYALPHLKPYSRFAHGTYPAAKQAAEEVANLPCYPHLQETQAKHVAACVRDYVNKVQKPS